MGGNWRRSGTLALTLALTACVTVPGLAVTSGAAVAAPGECRNPAEPGEVIPQTPWQQNWLAPERVWPFSTGAGVRVAVVDSGTDEGHPQLTGHVLRGFDALRNAPGGDFDCVSHGTAVGSIIAAQRAEGVGFQGLAPGATILPVRVTEREVDQGQGSRGASVQPAQFARAIRWAVDNGATVVNMSVVLYAPDPVVEDAIDYALSRNVVLVAAVGNQHQNGQRPDPVPFPAAYDGVIGVGAIDERGARVQQSQVGPYVDLVAPGGAVVAATRSAGHTVWTGTSFATPMVSATAALIRAAEPDLSAREVARRLFATADPARGGRSSEEYGHGVVNPYRAVTERLTSAKPVAQPPLPERPEDPAAEARSARWHEIARWATALALGAGALTAAVVGVALVLPRGRRRRWRATRAAAAAPPPQREFDEPEEAFFRLPTSTR